MNTYWKLIGALLVGYVLSTALAQGSAYRSSPPEGLFFKGVISYSADDNLILQYVIQNDGPNPIINDPQQIAVLYAAESLPIDVMRVPPPGLLNQLSTGEREYGTVIVHDAPVDSDNLEFYWRLTEIGPNTQYALTQQFGKMDEQSLVSLPQRASHPEWVAQRGN